MAHFFTNNSPLLPLKIGLQIKIEIILAVLAQMQKNLKVALSHI